MNHVTRIEGGRTLRCSGIGCESGTYDNARFPAVFAVKTKASLHYYCRECLPRKWRAFVNLGTAVVL